MLLFKVFAQVSRFDGQIADRTRQFLLLWYLWSTLELFYHHLFMACRAVLRDVVDQVLDEI